MYPIRIMLGEVNLQHRQISNISKGLMHHVCQGAYWQRFSFEKVCQMHSYGGAFALEAFACLEAFASFVMKIEAHFVLGINIY